MGDQINPAHYRAGGLESIDIIEGYRLGFALGNAVKYMLRAGRKSFDPTTDLQKADWYLDRASRSPLYDLQFDPGVLKMQAAKAKPDDVIAAFDLTPQLAEAIRCLLRTPLQRADVLLALSHVRAAIKGMV